MGDEERPPCPACGGAGGRVEDHSHDGKIVQVWKHCDACQGSGKAI
jgi:DnaJ-class molecular chaperone